MDRFNCENNHNFLTRGFVLYSTISVYIYINTYTRYIKAIHLRHKLT